MKKASWILLTVAGVLTLLGSLASAQLAYSGRPDPLLPNGTTIDDVAGPQTDVATALRARRGTAAAFAAAYSVLYLGVVLGPYRRGDRASWWALLAASLVLAVLSALRLPTLHTQAGVQTGIIPFAVTLVGLLLDVRRLKTAD
jgi:hypothetical protein